MRFSRKLSGWIGFAAWLYSWSLFAEIRNEFSVGGGSPPVWILVVLGFTTTALIAAAGASWMKFRLWPVAALLGGASFAVAVVATQFATMRIATSAVTIGDAFDAALRERSALGVGFVTAAPTLLILAGLTGWLSYLTSRNALEISDA